MKIRIIHCAVRSLIYQQDIIFTEDFKSPVEDFVVRGATVIFDKVCECDLPDLFPLETSFETGVLNGEM